MVTGRNVLTLLSGACLGCALALLTFTQNEPKTCPRRPQPPPKTAPLSPPYEEWFRRSGHVKRLISSDRLRYSPKPILNTESRILYDSIPILCVVMTTDDKYAEAVNSTWASSCNRVAFYGGLGRHDRREVGGEAKSSFHVLCEMVRKVRAEHSDAAWSLFVGDDVFAVPENLRRLVAPLNASEGHYLGHAVNFWGVDYNLAPAGFALSRGAVRALAEKFPDARSCIAGGKYWKQEDLYLGKHLRSISIYPADTRDEFGNTLFFTYDLDKIMFPNSMHHFANFYTRAIYPVKCCSDRMITFQVLSSTEMYRYHYMIYTMRIFLDGVYGNRPAQSVPDDQVWQEYLLQKGLPLDISSRQYEMSWYENFYNMTAFKNAFDKHFLSNRKNPYSIKKFLNLTNMSEVLAEVLLNYTPKKL